MSNYVYPVKVRRDRLKLGGVLYAILGLVVSSLGASFGEPMIAVIGGIPLLVGIFVFGYLRTLTIDELSGQLEFRRGWFFISRSTRYDCSEVVRLSVRERINHESQFSKFENQTYETALKTYYDIYLLLKNGKEHLVDSTMSKQDAILWAEDLAKVLRCEVTEDKTGSDHTGIGASRLMFILGLILKLVFVAVVFFVIFNLFMG